MRLVSLKPGAPQTGSLRQPHGGPGPLIPPDLGGKETAMTAQALLALAPLLLGPARLQGGPPARPDDAPKKAGDVRTEPYPLKDRSGRDVGAELWCLAVPENRQSPAPRLVELAFVRLRSNAERPGPPLVFLAGGPGSSGIEAARGPALPL